MIIIVDPDIRGHADRHAAKSHKVMAFVNGSITDFSVLSHGGRQRAQELANAYEPELVREDDPSLL